MGRLESIEVDDDVLDKIETKHNVTLEEAKQASLSDTRHVQKGREGLYLFFGRTEAGRYLVVVLTGVTGPVARLVTARDMTREEKRQYDKHRGKA